VTGGLVFDNGETGTFYFFSAFQGRPGVRLELGVTFEGGRKHVPTITLRRVA
jgi:hypothetical protein